MEQSPPNTMTLLAKVRTYAIVTIVAILIWLYLESENVKQQKPMRFTVQFVAPPAQQLLIIPADKPQAITAATKQQVDVTVSCATSQIAQLQRLQTEPILATVTEGSDGPIQIVDLRDMLQDSPIGDLGVTIDNIQPRRIQLRVERIEQVTMPINVFVADGVELATNPTINPAESSVGLPASIAKRLEALKLDAWLERDVANQLDPNVPRELTIPVTLSSSDQKLEELLDQLDIPITPPHTAITVTIRKQIGTLSLNSLPILLTAPWAELKRFSVAVEGGQRVLSEEVRITGPSDVIDHIETGELKVWADLRLTADDLESGISSKQIHINLPPNVHVESTIPRLNFTITPTVAPAPPAVP